RLPDRGPREGDRDARGGRADARAAGRREDDLRRHHSGPRDPGVRPHRPDRGGDPPLRLLAEDGGAHRVKLSVIMPVYNEREFVVPIIDKVLSIDLDGLEREVIVVDDCSKDGTRDLLAGLARPGVTVVYHDQNRGKGAALRTGFAHAGGDIILIQDAD